MRQNLVASAKAHQSLADFLDERAIGGIRCRCQREEREEKVLAKDLSN
jgi:hypothetical protein